MGTDDDDATDDGRSAVVGRSTIAGAKQKMSKLMMMFSYGTSGAADVIIPYSFKFCVIKFQNFPVMKQTYRNKSISLSS